MSNFFERWEPYKFLWENERNMRELLLVSLSEFESTLRKHGELEDLLITEPDMILFGRSIAVSTERLKYGLYTEIKSKFIKFLSYKDTVRNIRNLEILLNFRFHTQNWSGNEEEISKRNGICLCGNERNGS